MMLRIRTLNFSTLLLLAFLLSISQPHSQTPFVSLPSPPHFLLANFPSHPIPASPLSFQVVPAKEEMTFAVFGDSRPERDLNQPEIFDKIVEKINEVLPDVIFHTGDIIYGKTEDDANINRQYDDFFKVAKRLRSKMFVTPGNHDIWDPASAKIFEQRFGYLYRSVTIGSNNFIILNCELPDNKCLIPAEQRNWLENELKESGKMRRNIFVFVHRPVFPVDGYIGKSMDKFPSERNLLHELFKSHGVRFVFSGHEHLYHFQEKDGVKYVISGGGGAPLHVGEAKGGFYHFLIFTVKGKEISFEVRKIDRR
ncbi:MAG: metallophosphoesterase [Acidobacteriota bacterium]